MTVNVYHQIPNIADYFKKIFGERNDLIMSDGDVQKSGFKKNLLLITKYPVDQKTIEELIEKDELIAEIFDIGSEDKKGDGYRSKEIHIYSQPSEKNITDVAKQLDQKFSDDAQGVQIQIICHYQHA